MHIRDRIRELRRVRADQLLPNPMNWRTHPAPQRDALRGVLAEIGYASALVARETADGRLMLIDGHLRAETTPQSEVPVLVLDVTEAEADTLLATLDPLAALAGVERDRLTDLLATVNTDSAAVRRLLDGLAAEVPGPVSDPEADDLSRHFTILITCDDEAQQVELLARFANEGLACRALIA